MKNIALLVVSFLMTTVTASHALGSEGATVVRGHCSIRIGPYLLNYSGFQPGIHTKEPFCTDLPATGRTLIVLDVEQNSGGMGFTSDHYNELRDMLIDFRVLRNVGQTEEEDNVEQNTEVYLPPKKYPAGTLTLQHDFDKGDYIGLVTAHDYHGRTFVSRFPFRVGPKLGALPYAIGGLLLAAVGGGFFLAHRRSQALGRLALRRPISQ